MLMSFVIPRDRQSIGSMGGMFWGCVDNEDALDGDGDEQPILCFINGGIVDAPPDLATYLGRVFYRLSFPHKILER